MQNGQNQKQQKQQGQQQQIQQQKQQVQHQQIQQQKQQVQHQQVQQQRQQAQQQQVQQQIQQQKQQVQQQMTEEELQRTQVLNFDAFKQVARYEKLSSKKPALIVALIGILALIIGGGYPIVQSQMEKKSDDNANSAVQARKKVEEVKKTELTCVRNRPGVVAGLNETLTIVYSFENDKLTSFTKELVLTKANEEQGQTSLQNYLTALEAFLIQQDGYKMSVKQIDNGVSTTTSVDYKDLDINKIPEINQNNEYFNIIYIADTKTSAISQDMATQEFVCS